MGGLNPTKKPQPLLFPELTTRDYFHFLLKSRVTADKISKYSDALKKGSSSQKQENKLLQNMILCIQESSTEMHCGSCVMPDGNSSYRLGQKLM